MRGRRKEFLFVLCLVTPIIAALLYSSYESMVVLGAARAYVGGEGHWSKSQKNAAQDLARYATTGDDEDFAAYRAEIAVPLAGRVARLELEKEHPDLALARRSLVAGKNHPDDVDGMIMLFRRFRHFAYIDRAIGIWKTGDEGIERFVGVADRLRAEIATGHPDPVRVRVELSELRGLNDQLSILEDDFSSTLGEAARWVRRVLFLAQLATGAVLILLAGALTGIGFRRLRASEEDFRQLLEQAADGIFIVGAQGRFVVVNSRACVMLGYSREELLALRPSDIIDGDHPSGATFSLRWVKEGLPVLEERVLRRSDRGTLPVEISAKRLDDGRILAIARDISERKRAQEALQLIEEHLRQATKMEAIGRLAGGVAHDFNNLLTVMMGYAAALRSALPASSPEWRALEEIERAGQRGGALTRQLLAFSRKQVLEPEVLDLNAVVAGMEDFLRRLLGEGVELSLRLHGAPAWIRVDRGQIEQVVLNLAINAHEAMPKGGSIVVQTREAWVQAAERTRPDLAPGPYALLEVRDTGFGMDAETKAHIFEPFFTTKSLGKGTGLGLATVYGIVAQSGGAIAVESEPGRGSAFSVYLPSAEEPKAERKPAPAEPSARGGHETILLAEDEPAVRELLEGVLRAQGFQVLSAPSGPEALRLARAHPGTIDLVVTDVVMPGMTGPELFRELAAERPRLRALLVSGYTDQALDPYGGLPPGAAFLQKPFTAIELVGQVRKLLDGPGAI
jgi:two-component system cell cycle sensor histidine kinase/response regulator CckA